MSLPRKREPRRLSPGAGEAGLAFGPAFRQGTGLPPVIPLRRPLDSQGKSNRTAIFVAVTSKGGPACTLENPLHPSAELRGCPEMGSPEAAPIPFQTVLTDQNAVFLGFGEAWDRMLLSASRL